MAFYQIVYAVVIIIIIYLIYIYSGLKRHREIVKELEKMNGPIALPIVGNCLTVMGPPDIVHLNMRHIVRTFGPTVKAWIGPLPSVNTCCPEDIEVITSAMKNNQKGPIYDLLHMWLGTGLLTSHGDKWHTRRRILTPAFHFSILIQFVDIFNKHTEQLIKSLEKGDKNGFDIWQNISEYTLRGICETAMGASLTSTNVEEQVKYKNSVRILGNCILNRVLNPLLYSNSIYNLSSEGRKAKKNCNFVHEFSTKVIKERSDEYLKNLKEGNDININDNFDECYTRKKRMAMLDILLSAKFKEGIIDDTGIREEVDTFIFEGHDTTAVSLAYTLMLLANNRDCQDKVYEEICEVLPDQQKMPTYNDLNEMKYMERCIKESLRLYPSVPHISRVSGGNVISNGFTVPEGCMANVLIYDVHRRPDLWPNPEKFDPDRFLPENVAQRHPFAYLPFSAGPRNCIGQRFAMLEMKCCVTAIIKNFILEPVDTPETIRIIADLVLRSQNGVKVKFVPRS